MPTVYIIAGPNGAGKTTSANSLLPGILHAIEFVNADNIAVGISPFNPLSVNILAGRVMLQRISELRAERKDFVMETTLTTIYYRKMLRDMKLEGYTIYLIYLWLNSVELSIKRVAERVAKGGHDIPQAIIRRRYPKGIKNLSTFLPLCDIWQIFDNSETLAVPIVQGEGNVVKTVYSTDICKQILPHYYE